MTDTAGRNPDGTYDGRVVLSNASGGRLTPGDVGQIWNEVRANQVAWKECPASHHVVDLVQQLPAKFRCRVCGGTQDGKFLHYLDGFRAAGGDAYAVWPDQDEKPS